MDIKNGDSLKIDEDFILLMQPLTEEEAETARTAILEQGCTRSFPTWNNYLIDEYERYQLYVEAHVPYRTYNIAFANRERAITWICREQLKKTTLTPERFKYLIGKRYEIERIYYVPDKDHSAAPRTNYQKWQNHASAYTADKIGKEYSISSSTVYKYGIYAQTLDIIRKKNGDIVKRILDGYLKISHANVMELSRLPKEQIDHLDRTLSEEGITHVRFSELRHELQWKRVSEAPRTRPHVKPVPQEEILIKKNPAFDPDAEASSLIYTVPSWVSSIKRVQNTNLSIITAPARDKLTHQLGMLLNAANDLLVTIKEDCHG